MICTVELDACAVVVVSSAAVVLVVASSVVVVAVALVVLVVVVVTFAVELTVVVVVGVVIPSAALVCSCTACARETTVRVEEVMATPALVFTLPTEDSASTIPLLLLRTCFFICSATASGETGVAPAFEIVYDTKELAADALRPKRRPPPFRSREDCSPGGSCSSPFSRTRASSDLPCASELVDSSVRITVADCCWPLWTAVALLLPVLYKS
mmetsp:Transcript_17901/g.42009  ORF Transcript_17901/g.42009 Transcript_17901/m.42009 type:complete len:212 (-) Transcript_17901:71-706(-)